MLNIDGLASGLDTATIVEGLLAIQQQQVDRFSLRKQEVVEERAAFQGVETRLETLRATISDLATPRVNSLLRKSITSSDETLLTASVSNDAVTGTHTLLVNQLARNHQIGSNDFEEPDTALVAGTMTISVGNGKQYQLDTTGTLETLAERINRTVDGITASVIRHSGGYKLFLSGDETGSQNTISVSLTADNPAEQDQLPTFDLENPIQAAADAEVQLGSGDGALTINSASNQIDEMFPGVTMDLLKASKGEEVQLTVTSDVEAARSAVQTFVDAFNDVIAYTNEQNSINTETDEAGILFGNRTMLAVRRELALLVTSAIASPASIAAPPEEGGEGAEEKVQPLAVNRLTQLGVQVQNDGTLLLTGNQLDDILTGRHESIEADDIAAFFGYATESESDAIQFLGASGDTDTSTEYTVHVSQAAERASVLAGADLSASTVIDGSNNTLDISIDGLQVEGLTLGSGTYTPKELADHLENVINATDQLPGREVRVTLDGQQLRMTSLSYGTSSKVDGFGGTALAALMFTEESSDFGSNVVGSFSYDVVEGEEKTTIPEDAVGSGRILRAAAGNERSDGLSVLVTMTQAEIGSGHESDFRLSRGLGAGLQKLVDELINVEIGVDGGPDRKGMVPSAYDEFDGRIASIDASIERLNAQFEAQEQSLLTQFSALESRISELQGLSSLLAAQLGGLGTLGT